MFQVEVNHKINAPAEKVWQTIDKFGQVYTYHPLVKHSKSINDLPTGQGAERTCHFEDGNIIKERIINYEDNKKYQVEIYDPGKFPLQKAIGTLEVRSDDKARSNVTFIMDFQPKFGPIGWLMAHMVMKKQFSKILSKVLQGLDTHIQTGQIVGKSGMAQV
jgi:hypothetical protein